VKNEGILNTEKEKKKKKKEEHPTYNRTREG
jgi:hypothetical protein